MKRGLTREQIRNMTTELVVDSKVSIADLIESAEASKGGARIARYGWAIPNRLFGAYINEDGDAV